MKDLIPIENEKNDALTRLTRFAKKQDIVLTAEEEIILTRWTRVFTYLRQRKLKTEEIIEIIVRDFGVSKFTAQNDIANSQIYHSRLLYPDKRLQLALHIEDLNLKIKQAETDKSLAIILPKLYDTRLKAIIALEDMPPENETPAPIIYIGVVEGQAEPIPGQLTFEQAKELLKIKKQNNSVEDIDYEDVK